MATGSRALIHAGAEPIPGYRLLEPLGKGGFGEVWKCSAPGGLYKAIKFVAGNQELDHAGSNAAQELRALELIRSIRHPFLLSIERVEVVNSNLVIVMELADRSLHDLLADCRGRGEKGIPRQEAIGYLHEAAEVLDLLNQEHGLKHLDVKPRNLFLVGKHVKVADFGLVGSLADMVPGSRSGRPFAGGLTPLYAAPETFHGQVTLFSDQYSLAVTYHELVTGEPVFKARNYNQLAMLVAAEAPDLSGLPQEERPVLARALSRQPRERFACCVEFVNALEDAVFGSAHTPGRPATTTFDLSITDAPLLPRGSGFYRRRSRVMPAVGPSASAGTLASYQLLEALGRGPAGELWRAMGPGGGSFLLRFLALPENDPVLRRLQGIRHPALGAMRVVPAGPDRAAIITEAAATTIWDRFRQLHAAGQPGIPREELLAHLGRVGRALDELYHAHQLQHLCLSPRHIGLAGEEAFVVEFGLAELLWMPQGLSLAQLNPRYSAPELFGGLVSDAADQASLALIYQELLVGVHPYRNLNARQMASPRLRGQPDVSLLPGPDRPLVLRALSPRPEERFRSCQEFIQALEEAGTAPTAGPPAGAAGPVAGHAAVQDWKAPLEGLVAAAAKGHVVRTDAALPYRLLPGDHLECRAWARLAPGMARLKLDGFASQWKAERSVTSEGRYVFHIPGQATLWDRCMGRSPAMQVELCVGTPDAQTALSPLRVQLLPVDCPKSSADGMLSDMGPRILASLVTYMGLVGHRDGQERFPLSQPASVAASGRLLEGQLRDVGKDGLCVRLIRGATLSGTVTVALRRWASPLSFQVPGRVATTYPADEGVEVEIVLG